MSLKTVILPLIMIILVKIKIRKSLQCLFSWLKFTGGCGPLAKGDNGLGRKRLDGKFFLHTMQLTSLKLYFNYGYIEFECIQTRNIFRVKIYPELKHICFNYGYIINLDMFQHWIYLNSILEFTQQTNPDWIDFKTDLDLSFKSRI